MENYIPKPTLKGRRAISLKFKDQAISQIGRMQQGEELLWFPGAGSIESMEVLLVCAAADYRARSFALLRPHLAKTRKARC